MKLYNFFKSLAEKIESIFGQTTAILRILVNIDNYLKTTAKKEPASLTVARHTLGSLDITDITNPDSMPDGDYKEYCAKATQFYDFFEKEAEWMMKLQHDFWFRQGESWEQTMFGRGTMNGIQLMLDRFAELKMKYLQTLKKEEEPPLGSHEDILATLQVEGSVNPDTEEGEKK